MKNETKAAELAKQAEDERKYHENNVRQYGQGLKGKYGLVHYWDEDRKLQTYQVSAWEIIDDKLSCIVLRYADGFTSKRAIMPWSGIFRIDAYEDADDFKEAADKQAK